MDRPLKRRRNRAGWGLALVPLALVLAGCSSGGGTSAGTTQSTHAPDASLQSAGAAVQSAMKTYQSAVSGCATNSSPVVCLEAADHTLGDKVHTFANVLATGHGFTAAKADETTTLNQAQLLANSLEILGDAQPTQANYDQVQSTFNVSSAIAQLQGDVSTLIASLGK